MKNFRVSKRQPNFLAVEDTREKIVFSIWSYIEIIILQDSKQSVSNSGYPYKTGEKNAPGIMSTLYFEHSNHAKQFNSSNIFRRLNDTRFLSPQLKMICSSSNKKLNIDLRLRSG